MMVSETESGDTCAVRSICRNCRHRLFLEEVYQQVIFISIKPKKVFLVLVLVYRTMYTLEGPIHVRPHIPSHHPEKSPSLSAPPPIKPPPANPLRFSMPCFVTDRNSRNVSSWTPKMRL
jgi:hypothetical protein